MGNETKRIGEHAQALFEYTMTPECRKQIEELAEKAKRRQSPGYVGRGWAIDKAIIAIHKENTALRASLASVTKERDELKEADKWISVEGRLPENETRVIIYDKKNGIVVTDYSNTYIPNMIGFYEIWMGWRHDNVTHWLPLPPGPEKEK